MKTLILLSCALLLSTQILASAPTSNLNKDSVTLKALASAFKSDAALQPIQNKHDITMVYGGQDISNRPTIVEQTISA